jgi:hypothetical protein
MNETSKNSRDVLQMLTSSHHSAPVTPRICLNSGFGRKQFGLCVFASLLFATQPFTRLRYHRFCCLANDRLVHVVVLEVHAIAPLHHDGFTRTIEACSMSHTCDPARVTGCLIGRSRLPSLQSSAGIRKSATQAYEGPLRRLTSINLVRSPSNHHWGRLSH